jgi:hypothetical protein
MKTANWPYHVLGFSVLFMIPFLLISCAIYSKEDLARAQYGVMQASKEQSKLDFEVSIRKTRISHFYSISDSSAALQEIQDISPYEKRANYHKIEIEKAKEYYENIRSHCCTN